MSNLNDALGKDPKTVWKMLRELKDFENTEGKNNCQCYKMDQLSGNLITADVNVSHLDLPITSAGVL